MGAVRVLYYSLPYLVQAATTYWGGVEDLGSLFAGLLLLDASTVAEAFKTAIDAAPADAARAAFQATVGEQLARMAHVVRGGTPHAHETAELARGAGAAATAPSGALPWNNGSPAGLATSSSGSASLLDTSPRLGSRAAPLWSEQTLRTLLTTWVSSTIVAGVCADSSTPVRSNVGQLMASFAGTIRPLVVVGRRRQGDDWYRRRSCVLLLDYLTQIATTLGLRSCVQDVLTAQYASLGERLSKQSEAGGALRTWASQGPVAVCHLLTVVRPATRPPTRLRTQP